jgi:hypothetical protein
MPDESRRAAGALQYADADLIPLGDLLAAVSRAIGPIPAQAAIREAWNSDTDPVAFVGKKLIFADGRAAQKTDMQFLVRTEQVTMSPIALRALGLTLEQLAEGRVFTTPDPLAVKLDQAGTPVFPKPRARLFVFALRVDAARRWPGIIAPPPPPAIESGAPPAPSKPPTLPATRPKELGPKAWAAAREVITVDPHGTMKIDRLLAKMPDDPSRSTLMTALKWLRENGFR